tara:strand:+ start:640 stop:1050 length:411 start_codon:yes stop_codon:yes gene_type:complete
MYFKDQKHLKSAWQGSSRHNEKEWGHEEVWGAFQSMHGKVLTIKAGGKTSFKKHNHKNEVFYIMKGKVEITCGNERSLIDPIANPFQRFVLVEGNTFMVQSACPYQMLALEESKVIEIGDNLNDHAVYIDEAEIKL